MNPFRGLSSRIRAAVVREFRRGRFQRDFLHRLPPSMRDAAEFMYSDRPTAEEQQITEHIEAFRSKIASSSAGAEWYSYSSPHVGEFQLDQDGHANPGTYVPGSAATHAATGVKKRGGILLRRMVNGLGARTVLELGTNTGFSGCYFLSAPNVAELVTVEGSDSLCQVAAENLQRMSKQYEIMNMLFDAAIDELTRRAVQFDCVYIDGQHEREATWHYTKRVLPLLNRDGAIIYDDIYWSPDMNQFWKELSLSPEPFAVTIDLKKKGVGLLRTGVEPRTHHDICDWIGDRTIRMPGRR